MDILSALKDGYSKSEVMEELGRRTGMNYKQALSDGYSEDDVLGELNRRDLEKKATQEQQTPGPPDGGKVPGAAGSPKLEESWGTGFKKAAKSAGYQTGQAIGGLVHAIEEESLDALARTPFELASIALKPFDWAAEKITGRPVKKEESPAEAVSDLGKTITSPLPDIARKPIIGSAEKAIGIDTPLGKTAGDFWAEKAKESAPVVGDNKAKKHILGAAQSVIPATVAAGSAILARKPNVALNYFFGSSFGQEYDEQRRAGTDPAKAMAGGLISGTAEKYTEKIPLDALMKEGGNILARAVKSTALDIPGELLATTFQEGLVKKATTNPNFSLSDYWEALKDTAIQTAIAGPVQAGSVHPVVKFVEREHSNAIQEAVNQGKHSELSDEDLSNVLRDASKLSQVRPKDKGLQDAVVALQDESLRRKGTPSLSDAINQGGHKDLDDASLEAAIQTASELVNQNPNDAETFNILNSLQAEAEARKQASLETETIMPQVETKAEQAAPDYSALITTHAEQYGVEPSLLKAVAQADGGLMALDPQVANAIGIEDIADPDQNIQGGSMYLSALLQKYQGDENKALTAYKWGVKNVDLFGVENAPPEIKEYISSVQNLNPIGLIDSGLRTGQVNGAPFGENEAVSFIQEKLSDGTFSKDDLTKLKDQHPSLISPLNDLITESLKAEISQAVGITTEGGIQDGQTQKTETLLTPYTHQMGEPLATPFGQQQTPTYMLGKEVSGPKFAERPQVKTAPPAPLSKTNAATVGTQDEKTGGATPLIGSTASWTRGKETFSGTIQSIDEKNNLKIKAENGKIYSIRPDKVQNFKIETGKVSPPDEIVDSGANGEDGAGSAIDKGIAGGEAKAPWKMTREEWKKHNFNENEHRGLPEDYFADHQFNATKGGTSIDSTLPSGIEIRMGKYGIAYAFDGEKNIGMGDGKAFVVHPDYQKQGIGTALLGATYSGKPIGSRTSAGQSLIEGFHKKSVEVAIAEGKTVPEAVLKDYPELATKKESKYPEWMKGEIVDFESQGKTYRGVVARDHWGDKSVSGNVEIKVGDDRFFISPDRVKKTPTQKEAGTVKEQATGIHANQLDIADLRSFTSSGEIKELLKKNGIRLYDHTGNAKKALEAIGPRGANETWDQYLAKLKKYQEQEEAKAPKQSIRKVKKQSKPSGKLAGRYRGDPNEANENPQAAENAFKKDLKRYAKELNDVLGWEVDRDKKGKDISATVNIAPVGGDGHIILWKPKSEYGIYINVSVQREYNDDSLKIGGLVAPPIMYRATTKKDKYGGGANRWENNAAIMPQEFAEKIKAEVDFYDRVPEATTIIKEAQDAGFTEKEISTAFAEGEKVGQAESATGTPEEIQEKIDEIAEDLGVEVKEAPVEDLTQKSTAELISDIFSIINDHIGQRGSLSFAKKEESLDEGLYQKIKPYLAEVANRAKARAFDVKAYLFGAVDAIPAGSAKDIYETAASRYIDEENSLDNQEEGDKLEVKEGKENATPSASIQESGTTENDRTGVEGSSAEDVQGSEKGESTPVVSGKPRTTDDGELQSSSERTELEDADLESAANGEIAGEDDERDSGVGTNAGDVAGVQRSNDYRIGIGELTREGSWKTAAKNNLDAIELVKKLDSEKREATPEEKAILIKYVGWGASELANNMFPGFAERGEVTPSWLYGQEKAAWKPLVERMLSLLSPEEIKTAAKSTQYAHYTSESVIRSIYKAVERFGFPGGKILEPGMGTGHFLGLLPDSMIRSKYTGVEMDHVTSSIAKYLYPGQNIIQGDYTKQTFPNNFFDIGIGNPPFSQTKILVDPDYKKHRFALHDYFFAKTVDKVRPGGLLVFITSRYTMDKQNDKARAYLAERADLMGAIRLPQTAFRENAGTDVVTDVLFFRKKTPGVDTIGEAWAGVQEVTMPDTGENFFVNEYYINHPEMVLGTHSGLGKMRFKNEYTVKPFEGDIEEHFAKAVENLPENVYSITNLSPKEQEKAVIERDFNPMNKKEGGIYVNDKGQVMIVDNGSGISLKEFDSKLTDKQIKWLKDYVPLRDALKLAQLDQLQDGDWETSLKALQKAYDTFVKKNGRIWEYSSYFKKEIDEDGNETEVEYRRFKNEKLLNIDVEGTLAGLLEEVNEKGDIVKGPFLLERQIKVAQKPGIKNVHDALAVSLDEIGKLDVNHIAKMTGIKPDDAAAQLGDLIYEEPGRQGYVLADEYLSGDVVKKLEEAEVAATNDKKYRRNVEALKAVQPAPLKASDVTISAGSNWISTDYYDDFLEEVLGIENYRVVYSVSDNRWTLTGIDTANKNTHYYSRRKKSNAGKRQGMRGDASEWSHTDRGANEIFEAVLNNSTLKVTRSATRTEPAHTDTAATAAINDIAKKMRERFSTWVWEDADRAEDLLTTYNKKFNNLAGRKFDGSHLTLPGVSLKFKLHDHQKRAIWRILQSGNTYLGHAVGAGKTIEMIAAGMEMRRLGQINKPLYIVPNHMLRQFAGEFQELYPLAHIMVADEENFHSKNRQRFVARATLNNPDAIIMTHSSFDLIRIKAENIAPVRNKFIQQLRDSLTELQDDPTGNRIRIKKMEARIEQAGQRFDSMVAEHGKDNLVTFEEMGADFLFVDEAHQFRKLDFVTNRQAKGIDSIGSKRAMGLYIKTLWLDSQRPGRSHVFASGTPITNTMAEIYSIMRFFIEPEMARDGIDHFDAWANMYGIMSTDMEMNAAGRYEQVERFAEFINIPELMSRVRSFMDVITGSQLGSVVNRPEIAGGQAEIIVTPPLEELKAYQRDVLQPRIDSSKAWKPSKEQPGNPDPLINIITDGRLASIDMRYVDRNAKNNPGSKLNKFIDGIIEKYEATKGNEYVDGDSNPEPIKGGAVIAFYNHGFGKMVATKRGFDARGWLMTRLKDAGIPVSQVAWIDDYDTAAKKEAMMQEVRTGKKRILLGSAKKMGTGMNVQKRLAALEYLDAPWYPADVEQPDGRIVRQGNQNKVVSLRRYATKGSYDASMWQMVARKSRMQEQAFTGDRSLRKIQDVSESSQYAMASALASGDERAIQLASLKADLERLYRLEEAHHQEQRNLSWEQNGVKWDIKAKTERLAQFKEAEAKVPDYILHIAGKIGNKNYDKRAEYGEDLIREYSKVVSTFTKDGTKDLASINEFPLVITQTSDSWTREPKFTLRLIVTEDVKFAIEEGRDLGDSSPKGLVDRIVNQLNSLSSLVSRTESEIEDSKKELQKINKRIGAPFQYGRELAEKISEVARLEAELLDEGESAPDSDISAMTDATPDSTESETPQYSTKQTPGGGVTESDLKDLFPGQKIEKVGNLYVVTTKGGGFFLVENVERIDRNNGKVMLGYGRKMKQNEVISGSYLKGEIKISKSGDVWTLAHESIHYLEDAGLLDERDIAVLKAHVRRLVANKQFKTNNRNDIGGAEDRADFLMDAMSQRPKYTGLVGRVMDKVYRIVDAMGAMFGKRTVGSIIREVKSGEVYNKPVTRKLGMPLAEPSESDINRYMTSRKGTGDIPPKTTQRPEGGEPKWYSFGSEARKKYFDPDSIRGKGNYEIWDHDEGKWWTFRDKAHEQSFREKYPLAFLTEEPAGAEKTWYRFGKPPQGNRSVNFADNKGEAGVSVYATPEGNNPFFADRDVYSGPGRQIGWGSDGEPLIIPTGEWKKFNPNPPAPQGRPEGGRKRVLSYAEMFPGEPLTQSNLEKLRKYNSNLKIDYTETREFKSRFRGSKVVDSKGRPLMLYHGTGQKLTEITPGMDEPGAWFTTNRLGASSYAKGDDPNVYSVYLNAQKPFVADFSKGYSQETHTIKISGMVFDDNIPIVEYAEQNGYDSVHFKHGNFSEDSETWVVFSSDQVIINPDLPNPSRPPEVGGQFALTKSPAFKKWFGNSKVVDGNGEPLTMYHGTEGNFSVFKTGYELNTSGIAGLYFASEPEHANAFGAKGSVYPVYLSIQNPLDLDEHFDKDSVKGKLVKRFLPKLYKHARDSQKMRDTIGGGSFLDIKEVQELKALGYDGLIKSYSDKWKVAVAFDANQIKSATANIGTYDANNPDIRYNAKGLSAQDSAYLDAVANGDMKTAQEMVEAKALESGIPLLDNDEKLSFSYRRGAAPKETIKAYKLFKMRDGKLYPMFVGADSAVPVGVWLDAKGDDFFVLDNRGRKRVPAKTGEWTTLQDGSKMKTLAFRPGWHSGDIPYAIQIAPLNEQGQKSRYSNDVWAEIEIPADNDYTRQALDRASTTKAGNKNLKEAQLDHIPENGFYPYKTNSNAIGQWYISGSVKVNRILTESEVNDTLREKNISPMPWIGGNQDLGKYGMTAGEKTNTSKLLDPVTYDDQGNVIPLSERFNESSNDIRYKVEQAAAGPEKPRLKTVEELVAWLNEQSKATDDPFTETTRKQSSLSKKTYKQALESTLIAEDKAPDVLEYDVMPMQEQADLAADLINKDIAKAKRIALGQEEPEGKLRKGTVYRAIELWAHDQGDTELIAKLIRSPISLEMTKQGQEIAATRKKHLMETLGMKYYESPVNAVRDVEDILRENIEKRTGKKVSKEAEAEAEAWEKKFAELNKTITDQAAEIKKYTSQEYIDELIKKHGKEGKPRTVKPRAEYGAKNKVVTRESYEQAKQEWHKMFGSTQLHAGIDPSAIAALTKIGTYHFEAGARQFAAWAQKVVDDTHPSVKPYLKEVFEKAKSAFGQSLTQKIKKGIEKGRDLGELQRHVTDLTISFIEEGITDGNEVVEAVHNELRQIDPEITLEETRDAISGYGNWKPLTHDDVLDRYREIKQEQQLVAKLRDLQEKGTIEKTGRERQEMTPLARDLTKQVNELKKKYGLSMTDPGTQLRSALEAYKRRLEQQIADLDREIKTKEKIVREKYDLPLDQEAKKLKAERDRKKEIRDSIFGKPELSDEQRLRLALQAAKRSAAEYARRIAEHDFSPLLKNRKALTSEALDRAKKDRDEARKAYQELREAERPGEAAMKALDTRLRNELNRYKQMIANRDFVKQERKPRNLSPELKRLMEQRDTMRMGVRAAAEAAGRLTNEDIERIAKLASVVTELREAIDNGGDRLAYGAAVVAYHNYIEDLKGINDPIKTLLSNRIQQYKAEYKENPGKAIFNLASDSIKSVFDNSVAMVASFDDSFMGRQGLKVLFTHPSAWWPGAKNSVIDFIKTLGGQETIDAMKADIYSRPNFVNGSYGKAGIIAAYEEQYPANLAERAPVIGRVFKASEAAFVGSGMRMRADLYDLLADQAKSNGKDVLDQKEFIEPIGKLINNLTARGSWGKHRGESRVTRLILWAPKMLMANINTLVGVDYWTNLRNPTARREAGLNWLKVIGTTALIMAVASALGGDDDWVEWDPRSTDFGKIKIGDTRFDITGGMGSIVVLAARIITGKKKSATTGIVQGYTGDSFRQSRLDAFVQFLINKTTPPMGIVRDWLEGKTPTGERFTPEVAIYRAMTPIAVQNFIKLKDSASADRLAGAIVDVFGINTSSYSDSERQWNPNGSQREQKLYQRVGEKRFQELNKEYNTRVDSHIKELKRDPTWQRMSDEDKQAKLDKGRERIKAYYLGK